MCPGKPGPYIVLLLSNDAGLIIINIIIQRKQEERMNQD